MNYDLDPVESRNIYFRCWARIVYGSSQAEQNQEFATGILMGLSVSSFKMAMETVEGIYAAIKDPAQLAKILG